MEDVKKDIFNQLRPLLLDCVPPMVIQSDYESRLELSNGRETVFQGRKYSEMFFAALIIQKNYVGFYFMPVYIAPEMRELLSPSLAKMLKGKSCFHIRKTDPFLLAEVQDILQKGLDKYKALELL